MNKTSEYLIKVADHFELTVDELLHFICKGAPLVHQYEVETGGDIG
jgi:hypothetical protein